MNGVDIGIRSERSTKYERGCAPSTTFPAMRARDPNNEFPPRVVATADTLDREQSDDSGAARLNRRARAGPRDRRIDIRREPRLGAIRFIRRRADVARDVGIASQCEIRVNIRSNPAADHEVIIFKWKG